MRRSVGHHEGALSPCCVKTPPSVSSHYTPKGHLHVGKVPNTGDLEIYEAPFDASKKPTSLIICAYDIFGFHPNTKEVCDNIALATGARVIMPDFYRGDYWSESRSIQLMYSWVTYHGSWGQTKQDLINIIEFYKAHEGIHSVGIFGMCWGGKVSVWAGSEIPAIRCAGLIHPSGVSIDEADKIHCPVIVLPSRDEIDFLPFKDAIEKKLGHGTGEHHRYDNMKHGFCAARGDFADRENREAVDDIVLRISKFFCRHLE